MPRRISKLSKEVENDIEHDGLEELDGYICNDASYGLSCRVIESVRVVLLYNGPLGVERRNFTDRSQSWRYSVK